LARRFVLIQNITERNLHPKEESESLFYLSSILRDLEVHTNASYPDQEYISFLRSEMLYSTCYILFS